MRCGVSGDLRLLNLRRLAVAVARSSDRSGCPRGATSTPRGGVTRTELRAVLPRRRGRRPGVARGVILVPRRVARSVSRLLGGVRVARRGGRVTEATRGRAAVDGGVLAHAGGGRARALWAGPAVPRGEPRLPRGVPGIRGHVAGRVEGRVDRGVAGNRRSRWPREEIGAVAVRGARSRRF